MSAKLTATSQGFVIQPRNLPKATTPPASLELLGSHMPGSDVVMVIVRDGEGAPRSSIAVPLSVLIDAVAGLAAMRL